MNGAFGLAADQYTWSIAVALALAWAFSVMFCPRWRQRRFWAVPMSLFGFVWLGFGLNFVARYALLAYDSVLFGNLTYRLADRPAAVVDDALLLAGGYWVSLVVGYMAVVRRRAGGVFAVLDPLAEPGAQLPRFVLTAVCAVCIALESGPFEVPLALVTPLGAIGRLWVVPAALAWWDYYRGRETPGSAPLRVASLVPGALQAALSPYREHLLLVVLLPFVAGLFAGKRYRLSVVLVGSFALALGSTVVIGAARLVMWSGYSVDEVAAEDLWGGDDPEEGPWLQTLRRFHGLDSLLLTVDRVPSEFPFQDRQVLVEAALRAFVPRLIYDSKELVQRGFEFSETIWSDQEERVSPAAIAPSMPGDLYRANGPINVLLGALVWGVLLGLCDGWAQRLPAGVTAAVVLLFGALSFASVERDFVHAVGTLVQTLMVLTVVGWGTVALWRLRQGGVRTDRMDRLGQRRTPGAGNRWHYPVGG